MRAGWIWANTDLNPFLSPSPPSPPKIDFNTSQPNVYRSPCMVDRVILPANSTEAVTSTRHTRPAALGFANGPRVSFGCGQTVFMAEFKHFSLPPPLCPSLAERL